MKTSASDHQLVVFAAWCSSNFNMYSNSDKKNLERIAQTNNMQVRSLKFIFTLIITPLCQMQHLSTAAHSVIALLCNKSPPPKDRASKAFRCFTTFKVIPHTHLESQEDPVVGIPAVE